MLETFSIPVCRLLTWVCSLCENSSCTRYFGTLLHISLSLFLEGKIIKYKKNERFIAPLSATVLLDTRRLIHPRGQKRGVRKLRVVAECQAEAVLGGGSPGALEIPLQTDTFQYK